MSQQYAYSRAVVFLTLHRGQRDTRLCLLLVNYSTLYYLLHFTSPGVFLSSPRHSYIPSSYATEAAAYCAPARSIPVCSHHHTPNHAPGSLSDTSHSSNSDCIAIYCATVFWSRLKYSSIVKKPAASLADAAEVYFHVPSIVLHGILPVNRLVTWV